MNRNILCFCIGIMFFLTGPAMTQVSGTASPKAASAKAKKIEVKDYKSFKKYVANEEANLKSKPVTTDNGPAQERLEKMGIRFKSIHSLGKSSDGKMAYVSPDKKGIAVVDRRAKTIALFDAQGVLIKKIQIEKEPVGVVGFSQTRVFEFKGNFEDKAGAVDIYDFSGKLIKTATDSGIVDVFMVSHDQKWLAVSSADWIKNEDYFILYDVNGNEIWRRNTVTTSHPQIEFSRDDKYVVLKLPTYLRDPRNRESGGSRFVYVFRVSDGHLISEENYVD